MRLLKILITFYVNIFFVNAQNINISKCYQSDDFSRVIIAGGSLTEIFFFLGIQNSIAGVDITSDFPIEATKLPSIGYVRTLSTEGILSLEPTLVIGENDMGPPMVIDQLQKTSIDLRIIPEKRTINGIIEKIRCVASIASHENQASIIIEKELQPKIDELLILQKNNSLKPNKAMLILSMGGTSPIIAGKNTSGNGFINIIGAKNIFNTFEGWKPVSIESILKNNPDFIIIPQRDVHKNSDIASLLKNPNLKEINAIKNKNIISEDAMAMLGFGPRTIDIALKASKAIAINE